MNWLLWNLGLVVRWRMNKPGVGRWTIQLGRFAKPDMISACIAQVEAFKADGWAVESAPPASFTKSR